MSLPLSAFWRAGLALLLLTITGFAQQGLQRWELTVDGVAREALVHAPAEAKNSETPLVFAFHGHGGTAQGAAAMFAVHRHWPAAIAIYMQGLNTPGRLTDPEGKKPGWQHKASAESDRDLHFFDAVLQRARTEYKVDPRRIYATGHSNGGSFTYILWAERGDLFAAVAPSGSAAAESLPKLKPKPAMHIAGQQDPLVKFEWQERTIAAVRRLNGCEEAGTAWAPNATLYPSKSGTPFVAYLYPGGHRFPAAEAASQIVRFFQAHAKKE